MKFHRVSLIEAMTNPKCIFGHDIYSFRNAVIVLGPSGGYYYDARCYTEDLQVYRYAGTVGKNFKGREYAVTVATSYNEHNIFTNDFLSIYADTRLTTATGEIGGRGVEDSVMHGFVVAAMINIAISMERSHP